MGPRAARRRRGRGGRRAPARRGRRARRARSPSATRAGSPSSTAPASPRRCASSAASPSSSAAPAPTRACASPPTPPTPSAARCMQQVQERATAIETKLLFFELEWAALDDERAEELLAADGPRLLPPPPAHRRAATGRTCSPSPRRRSSPRRALTGRSAWARLFAELTSAIEVELDGDEVAARRRAVARSISPDREVRRATAEAVTAALEPGLRTRAFIFNTLLARQGRRRPPAPLPHWLASRNLSNEASDESVAGARRGGAQAATTSRSAGTGSRRSCSGSTGSPTTTAWPR